MLNLPPLFIILYKHFKDHLIISYNHYFHVIIEQVPLWDIPFLLSLLKAIYYVFHFMFHLTFPLIVFIKSVTFWNIKWSCFLFLVLEIHYNLVKFTNLEKNTWFEPCHFAINVRYSKSHRTTPRLSQVKWSCFGINKVLDVKIACTFN